MKEITYGIVVSMIFPYFSSQLIARTTEFDAITLYDQLFRIC